MVNYIGKCFLVHTGSFKPLLARIIECYINKFVLLSQPGLTARVHDVRHEINKRGLGHQINTFFNRDLCIDLVNLSSVGVYHLLKMTIKIKEGQSVHVFFFSKGPSSIWVCSLMLIGLCPEVRKVDLQLWKNSSFPKAEPCKCPFIFPFLPSPSSFLRTISWVHTVTGSRQRLFG